MLRDASNGRPAAVLGATLLVLITLAAYGPAMWAGGFIWDDDAYLTNNPTLQAPNALERIWFDRSASPQYYPLVFTMFWAERQIWGLTPTGYHVVNVLLHGGSAVLLWQVLRRLKAPGALLAAAVFAVHPVMVESVAWVTERKNTLAGFFFLAALLMYLRFALPAEGEDGRRRWWWYGGALGLFVCALLSKSVACAFPVVVLLILWWKKDRLTWRDAAWTVPFFLLGLAAGLQTAWLEVHHVGASGAMWSYTPLERVLIAGRGLWFYAGKIVAPVGLIFYYKQWVPDAGAWMQYLYVAGVLGVMAWLFLARGRIGKGPFAAVLAYAAVLFPALGFFNLYPMIFSLVADHFQYLASPALIALLAAVLTLGAQRLMPDSNGLAKVLAVLLLLTLGSLTYAQCYNYRDAKTLWLSINARNPHWNAYVGLSAELNREAAAQAQQGQQAQADALIDQAIDCDVQALALRPNYDVALYNLGCDYRYKKNYVRSIEYHRQAIALAPGNAVYHYGLGKTLALANQPQEALKEYLEAIRLNPGDADQRVTLAGLLLDMDKEEQASQCLAGALQLNPRNADAHLLQGFIFARNDRLNEAVGEFESAVREAPENLEAVNALAKILAVNPTSTADQLQRALKLAESVVEKTSRSKAGYLDTLAMVLHRLGRDEEALRILQEALSRLAAGDAAGRASVLRHMQAYKGAVQPGQ